jgi:hypothetical protein
MSLKSVLPLVVLTAGAALAAQAPGGRYGLDTPIQTIAADPEGAAVLNQDIPGLLSNASYDSFKVLSLRQIGALSGGRLTHNTLTRTQTDLRMLRAHREAPPVRKIRY